MLVLLFYLGDDMYAMGCEKIREIVPLVNLKDMPGSPDYLAGIFNYRGAVVPVIDLRMLIQGHRCQMRLSTRIILVDWLEGDASSPSVIGLMAERVTETVKKPEHAFVSSGLKVENAPFLGGFIMEQDEMIQFIDLGRLRDRVRLLPVPQERE